MKASFRIGNFWGVDVFIHFTFVAFVLLFGWMGYSDPDVQRVGGNLPWIAAGNSMLAVLLFFVCVVLHEYGHIFMARRFGVGTRDILLLPIGGVARLDRIPEKPREELLVALAGPAVNAVIAGVLYLFISLTDVPLLEHFINNRLGWAKTFFDEGLLPMLVRWNLVMIAFNMLPAFPMDGGRVLRALLGIKLGHSKATRIAAAIGQGMAVVMAIWAWQNAHYVLILTAVFVWIGAEREAEATQHQSTLSAYTAGQAMLKQFVHFTPGQSVWAAIQQLNAGLQTDFPLLENGQLVGVITLRTLVEASKDGALHQSSLASIGHKSPAIISAQLPLSQAENILQVEKSAALCVAENGQLVGLLNPTIIKKFLLLREAGVPL